MQNQKKDAAGGVAIEVQDLSTVKKKLQITVGAGDVKKEIDAAYKELKAGAAVAGFRKGAVPKNILKARYGESVTGDVATRLVQSSYQEALKSKGLSPVDNPQFDMDIKDLKEGAPFSFSVTVEVNPEVEIDGYMGMGLKKEAVEVSDKDVDEGLKRLQEGNTEFREVERAAAEGDLVVVDFKASLEGKPIEKSDAKDYPIVIGQSTPLPGMDTALVGLVKGASKDVKLAYPENFGDTELAGKEALFSITLKTVKEKVVPELDDEFAKDLEYGSLAELREKVAEEVKHVKENNAKEKLKNEILDKLIEAHPFEVPEALVTRYHALIMNNVIQNMRSGVINPEDRTLNSEQLKAKYRTEAERRVREDIVLDSIAAKEKVEVSKEETEKAIQNLADGRGVSFDSLMARIQREGSLEVIIDGLKHEKVFDLIIDSGKPAS